MKIRSLIMFFIAMVGVWLTPALASEIVKPVNLQAVEQVQARTLKDLAQQIKVDEQSNAIAQNKLNQLKKRHQEILNALTDEQFSTQLLENKQLALAEAQADRLNVSQLLVDAQQKLSEIQAAIKYYQEQLRDAQAVAVRNQQPKLAIDKLKWRLDYLHTYLELHAKHIDQLEKSNAIADEFVRLEQEIYNYLLQFSQRHENSLREKQLLEIADQMQRKRADLLEQLKSYNEKLDDFDEDQRFSNPIAIRLALRIYQAEEEIFIGEQELRIEQLNDELADLIALSHDNLTVREIDRFLNDLKQVSLHVIQTKKRVDSKLQLTNSKIDIQKQLRTQKIISPTEFKDNHALLNQLLSSYKHLMQRSDDIAGLLEQHEASLRTTLNKNIAQRQGFPGWSLEEWNNLVLKISHIPVSFIGLSKTLSDHVLLSFRTINPSLLSLIFFINCLWVVIFISGRRLLYGLVKVLALRQEKMSINVALGLVETSRRLFAFIILYAFIFSTLYLLQIPYKTYYFLLILFSIILGVMYLMGLARIALLERMSDTSGMDVKVYHYLKWAMTVGSVVLIFNTMAQELNIAYDVRDFFNRIFMIFLFVFSVILFRLRLFITQLITPYIEAKRLYLRRATELLIWLIPLTLMSNAIVGLAGYLQLAGVMSYYQFMLLLVTTGYVILRGGIIDLMELLSDATIRNARHGWLVSQALLIPLDKAVRFILFLFAWVVLFYSFGWDMESYVVTQLINIINTPLISLTGAQITILSFVEFIILGIIVFWAARWSREISYRVLFVDVRDQAVRNSLSAFTRYATILFGTIITLQVLGINISGLSYILGGLAVGLGFGLRDFANNIVSGLMLLIERPVREGDIVTINEHEGIVSRIGLRSLTLKSYDYVEVMVPNADILNKTFTNWTHQDSIARSTVPIKVHRYDDPIMVQEIILQVLHELPAVLDDPEPKVFLRKLDDVLIYMEARYFINLQDNLRVSVESLVLFSIWERFKAHNIRAPFPQHDVRLLADAASTSGTEGSRETS